MSAAAEVDVTAAVEADCASVVVMFLLASAGACEGLAVADSTGSEALVALVVGVTVVFAFLTLETCCGPFVLAAPAVFTAASASVVVLMTFVVTSVVVVFSGSFEVAADLLSFASVGAASFVVLLADALPTAAVFAAIVVVLTALVVAAFVVVLAVSPEVVVVTVVSLAVVVAASFVVLLVDALLIPEVLAVTVVVNGTRLPSGPKLFFAEPRFDAFVPLVDVDMLRPPCLSTWIVDDEVVVVVDDEVVVVAVVVRISVVVSTDVEDDATVLFRVGVVDDV